MSPCAFCSLSLPSNYGLVALNMPSPDPLGHVRAAAMRTRAAPRAQAAARGPAPARRRGTA